MTNINAAPSYDSPVYSLEYEIYGTGANIHLNDIPVFSHNAQGQISSQKPVPEFIIEGKNTLHIESFPLKSDSNEYSDGAYIEAIITVREKDAPINQGVPALQLKINPKSNKKNLLDGTENETGNDDINILSHELNTTTVERSVLISSPYPKWSWQNGQVIENTKANLNSLFKKYEDIWIALNSKDIKTIYAHYDLAAQELSSAYFYKNKENAHNLINTGGLVNDNDWVLADINKLRSKMKYKLNIYADGKMANIIDQDERTPIIYLSKKVKTLNIQKFGFYKNNNNEWVMIR